ncbi:MAG TPA: class I SAM-dependent methyltransferase [Mucilaginibacter sp.]|jgi:predicted O-methyltransferase YrrM|nr:class I SAM-dependent methyltransferase [Mucilaginibacter sp.]
MFNLRFAKDYLLHRFKAKNRHGLHSPFVYRLADKIIYDFDAKKVYAGIENLRDKLLIDNRIINVTGLAAGSRIKVDRKKKVAEIAMRTLKPKLAQLLYRLAKDLNPLTIIELGTCLGITTLYLQNAAPQAKVYTLDGCPETAAITRDNFREAGLNNIDLITGNFDETLPGVINKLNQLDFVFVDGARQKEAILKYFERCLPKVHERTLLIFDDIYRDEGMKEAWAAIKAHPKVTVTIDLFWIGLVYFRPGQAKENFLVKF